MLTRNRLIPILFLFSSLPLTAQREPVLKQIDLPHPYYFREMYLPQLTTGPSAVAWAPDSHSLVYSMAGSLWRQELDSTTAQQLTAGSGYDYQPDCSRDGRWVVYASYEKDAVELWALNLQTGRTRQLTQGGAVNVEPRLSPDGKRVAFVSTSFNGHFHIFVGEFANGELKNVQRLTGENRSNLARYYYSQVDHEISPAWTPDGSEITFRLQSRPHLRYRRFLAHEGRTRCRSARDPLRRNRLEGAAGFFTRRQAYRLRIVPGATVAPTLGDAGARW